MNTENTGKASPIAIVGIGCIFPKAENLRRFWSNIKNRVDAITDVPTTHWKEEDYFDKNPKAPDMTYAKRGGFLLPLDFDPGEFGISPNTLEATDSAQLLGLVAAQMALKDAGYGTEKEYDRSRVSVVLGVTGTLQLVIPLGARLAHPQWKKVLLEAGVDQQTADKVSDKIAEGFVPWQESSFPGLLGNVVAGRIANRFNLGGTNCVVDAACGSSLSAMHLAVMELQAGRSTMVLSGGVDCFNDIFMFMCFSKTPALSHTGDIKPFDKNADGTLLGEGLGMVALKRLEDAERDGDRIYAVIRGVGTSSDGKGKSIYAPSSDGQSRALKEAYRVTGISPATIGLIEAHGTGTAVGDGVEVDGLAQVFREAGAGEGVCALGSVKSMIGHTKASAGSAGVIKAALSLYNKVLPPTIKVSEPHPKIKGTPFYLNTEKRPWLKGENPRRAGVSALGFGGSNFHAIVEEYKPEKPGDDWDGDSQLAAFSADDEQGLKSKIAVFKPASWDEARLQAARSRAEFSSSANCRLAFTFEFSGKHSPAEMAAKAVALLDGNKGKALWSSTEGIYYGFGPALKPAAIFPGQGAQYPGMLRDSVCSFRDAFETFENASAVFGGSLIDLVYPKPSFTAEGKKAQEDALQDTSAAQPAIGAVSYGAFRALRRFGLKPEYFAGHSYGELAALCAAGKISEQSLHKLSCLRGKLMKGNGEDRGTMLAVVAQETVIASVIAEEKLNLVIANKNAPEQSVLSGARAEIEKAAAAFAARKIKAVKLSVAAAFHSPLVADAQVEFRKALEGVDFAQNTPPVYANKTAGVYPAGPAEAKDLLASQLASPVEFVRLIEAMYADGARVFVEIGPGTRMGGLVGKILGSREHVSVAVDSSSGRRNGLADFARVLAQLAACGVAVDLKRWEGGEDSVKEIADRKKPAMTVKLSGINYRSPKKTQLPKVTINCGAPAQNSGAVPSALSSAANNNPALMSALVSAQQNMAALARMQEEAARLHAQFLESQAASQRAIYALIEQQRQAVGFGGAPAQLPAMPQYQPQAFAAPVPPQQPIALPQQPVVVPLTAVQPVKQSVQTGKIEKVVLEIVSSQTGYPVEMLKLDMDMESDLGIDSIKRVAILSEVQEKLPDAPQVKPEHLGTMRTLRQVMDYLSAGMPAAQAAPVAASSSVDTGKIQSVVLEIVSSQTGYPVEMLKLDMDMESDLGIDSIKRVAILSEVQEKLPEAPQVKPEHLGTMRTLRQVMDYLSAGMPVAQAAPVAASSSIDTGKIQSVVLEIVSSQTGYPVEMLKLDMDMESDLGIDSIKRVAILSEVQEKLPDAPQVKPEHLGTMRTLRQVMDYLSAGMPAAQAAPVAATASSDTGKIQSVVLEIVSSQTGYPVEMLKLDMDMESDLGIDSIKRVAILSEVQEKLPDAPQVKPEHLGTMRTLRQVIAYLLGAQSEAPAVEVKPAAAAEVKQDEAVITRQVIKTLPLPPDSARSAVRLDAAAPIFVTDDGSALSHQLVKTLSQRGFSAQLLDVAAWDKGPAPQKAAALVVVAPHSKMSPSGWWAESDEAFVRSAFFTVKKFGPALQAAAQGNMSSALMTVERLDGRFGLSGMKGEENPVYGGLSGLLKSAAREWPTVSCKAVDADGSWEDVVSMASVLADELLLKGPMELGLSRNSECALVLDETALPEPGKLNLSKGDVALITGGARGVTAEAAAALAANSGATLVLVGRSPAPQAEEPWLARLATQAEVKRALMERMGVEATPRVIGEKTSAIFAAREMRRQLARFEALGSRAVYHSADIRNAEEVKKLLSRVEAEHGKIRAVVHGAGVLADKLLADKTPEMFDAVFSTKVRGLRNILSCVDVSGLKVLVLFSSSTARYGRAGQADYAVANEILNKTAQLVARRVTSCKTVAFNWGPWDGGMVNPALKKVFHAEGIAAIPLESGSKFLANELALSGGDVEVTVIAKPAGTQLPLKPAQASELTRVFEKNVSLEEMPFLSSHVINGKAVLPLAITTEWLAHAALHGNPGLNFAGFNSLKVLKGVILEGGKARRVSAFTGKAVRNGELYSVHCELRGENNVLHASAEMLLCASVQKAPVPSLELALRSYHKSVDEVYSEILFHGHDMRAIKAVNGVAGGGIAVDAVCAAPPQNWEKHPLRDGWITDPLILDAAYQAMIVWTCERMGACSLPNAVLSYRQYVDRFPAGGVKVAAKITRALENSALADIEFTSPDGALVARMEAYECTADKALNAMFRNNTAVGAA